MPSRSPDAATTLRFTGNVRRMRLRPGDHIVVEVTENISPDQAKCISKLLAEKYPENPVLLMANGLRLAAVLKPEEAA